MEALLSISDTEIGQGVWKQNKQTTKRPEPGRKREEKLAVASMMAQ